MDSHEQAIDQTGGGKGAVGGGESRHTCPAPAAEVAGDQGQGAEEDDPRPGGLRWNCMSKRSIKQAVERAQRADAKAEASVLRQQRKLQEIKVTARKKTTRIKIVLGADVLALKQGRISGDEFE